MLYHSHPDVCQSIRVCTLTIRCSDINHSPFVYPFHRDIGNFVCFAFPFLLAFRPVLRQQNHWSASLDVGSHVVKKPRARRIFRFDFNHLNRSMINHRFGFQMIATNDDDDDDESFEIGSQSIWCQIGIPTLSIFVIESLYFVASILLLRLGLRQKTVNLSGRFRRARAAEYTKSKWTVLSVIQKGLFMIRSRLPTCTPDWQRIFSIGFRSRIRQRSGTSESVLSLKRRWRQKCVSVEKPIGDFLFQWSTKMMCITAYIFLGCRYL